MSTSADKIFLKRVREAFERAMEHAFSVNMEETARIGGERSFYLRIEYLEYEYPSTENKT